MADTSLTWATSLQPHIPLLALHAPPIEATAADGLRTKTKEGDTANDISLGPERPPSVLSLRRRLVGPPHIHVGIRLVTAPGALAALALQDLDGGPPLSRGTQLLGPLRRP